MDICQQTGRGRFLALVVVPALFVGVVLGPQAWETLTASIDLPIKVASFWIGGALLWLVSALIAWVALWVAGGEAHADDHRNRPARVSAAGAIVATLLLAGTLPGNALRESGCGEGRDAALAELVPIGAARATYSEDDLKDVCHGEYWTAAAPVDVFAHHSAQLTSSGWEVTPPSPISFPPHLQARRRSLSLSVSINAIDGKNWVQLSADRLE